MRVAVTFEQCWHSVPGGTARAAIDQIAAVDALGEVDLVGVSARHRDDPPEPWVPPIAVEQLRIPRLLMYEGWHHLGWPHLQDATGPIDLIHATGVAVPPRNVPLVVTVHDLAVRHDPSTFTRRGVSFMRRAIELTKERADLVLCSSRATLDDCLADGFVEDRLRLVPLGVTVSPATDHEVALVRDAYGLPERYLIFVGTHEPRKNLAGLLAAYEVLDRSQEVGLVLVGPDGWGDHGAGVGDRPPGVTTLGFVPLADLGPLYAGAAVSCYPSLLEGFGLPVLEAMAQATPVVTSTGTATEELVAGGGGIAVDPRSPEDIAAAIARLLDDEAAAGEMGRRGREVAAGYTWERTARLTVDAYREAAG